MKAISSYLLVPTLVLFCLFVLEGACFRLIEGYANKRLEFAWGKPGNGQFHNLLRRLPLVHFADPPGTQEVSELSDRANLEDQFSRSMMSFGRPLRDRLKEEMEETNDPLVNFEIRDFGPVRGVVLPGLKKIANREDVIEERARRVGDSMEYAKGLVVRVFNKDENQEINQEFDRMEFMFKFFLKEGLACVVMPASSAAELLQKTREFRKQNPMIAENIFVWGEKESAELIMEVCVEEPTNFKCLLINEPTGNLAPPSIRGMPWILVGKATAFSPDDKSMANLFKWIVRGRDADFLYPSRLGGLLKLYDPRVISEYDLFAVAYVLKCLDYITLASDKWPEPKPMEEKQSSINQDEVVNQYRNKEGIDLFLVQEKILSLKDEEPISFATFDCEIIRGYREMHSNDLNLKMVTNRDLVLKLGMSFEEMGSEVLRRIGDKDPLFLRFYRSLKEVEDYPLN
ncbi:MAG: hypothetical protein CMI27_05435 [Opitutae bacterium]|nr:hypothetical protein [Opitutae bacterium]